MLNMPCECTSSKNNEIHTPLNIVLKCLSLMNIQEKDSVLDCCAGTNMIWYNNINSISKEWCEILKGVDFMDYQGEIDYLVGNLPFNKFKPFFEKIMSLKINKGIGIISLSHHFTPTRLLRMQEKGFYISHIRRLKIPEWKFGYNVDFVLFNKIENKFFNVLISK